MSKNKIIGLALVVLTLFACSSTNHIKIRIELPSKAELPLEKYDQLIITNFLINPDAPDFDMNKEASDYFSYEFEHKLSKKTSIHEASLDSEEAFQNKDFWKGLTPDITDAVIFTGSINYIAETRKALLRKDKRRFEDPFPPQETLAKRTFYTLEMDVYFINNTTGESIYSHKFKESASYKNPNQTAYFAFFDLMQKVRDKLFQTILGGEKLQQRYLISK